MDLRSNEQKCESQCRHSYLCDFGQLSYPLWESTSASVKGVDWKLWETGHRVQRESWTVAGFRNEWNRSGWLWTSWLQKWQSPQDGAIEMMQPCTSWDHSNAKSQIPRAGHLFGLAWVSCLGRVRCFVGLPTRTACYEWGQVSWEDLGGNRSFVGGYTDVCSVGLLRRSWTRDVCVCVCVCVYVHEGIFYENYPCLLSEPGVELRFFLNQAHRI